MFQRKNVPAVLCFLLLFGICFLNPLKVEAALPEVVENLWLYTGSEELNDAEGLAGRVWIRGNAYGKPLKGNNPNIINTSDASYKSAYDKLQKNKFLTEANICIIYLPNCPYTHSWLPVYQNMAKEAGARVVLVDVTKYDTSSLLPYYWASKEGAASPIVLYKDKDGNLGGMSGVHDTFAFMDILTKCGYFVESDNYQNDTGYTTADWYKRTVLSETNKIRIENGKAPLSTFDVLDEVADIRAEEVAELASHTRPNGELFNKLIDAKKIAYPNWVGENLCCGSSLPTPMSAVIGWMNSKPHRENILSDKYSHLSIGYYANKQLDKKGENNGNNWIQIFAGKCTFTDMKVTQYGQEVDVIKLDQGGSISDLNLDVSLTCSHHGTSSMPLLDEMVTGFDAGKAGEQRVTIHVGDMTCDRIIEVGEMTPVPLTEEMVQFKSDDAVVYDGQEKCPEILVSNPEGDYYLMEDYSYSVEYKNNSNAGTASVIITGKGNYYGTVTKEFTIAPRPLEDSWVSGVKDIYEYTGKAVRPVPSVQRGASLLKAGTDYEVAYGENTGALAGKRGQPTGVTGTGTVTVTGKGNYTGTVEKTFDFALNDVHRQAEILRFRLNPKPNEYKSVYAFWKAMMEYPQNVWETPLKDTIESFEKFKAGKESNGRIITLEEIMNCPLAPGVAEDVQDFCRFMAELEGVGVESRVDVNTSTGISKIQIAGLEGSVKKESSQGTMAQAVLTVTDCSEKLTVNEKAYDTSSGLPLDISLTMDEKKAVLEVPVTISVTLPEDYYQEGDTLVALHYANGPAQVPTELSVAVKGKEASFSTGSFSPFVLIKKLPQYEGAQLHGGTAANDPSMSGMNFGAEDNRGVSAPTEVYISKNEDNTVTVHWKAAEEGSGYEIKGYKVLYADNPLLENAGETRTVSETKVVLPSLQEGTYYIAVKTVAASAALSGDAESLPSDINVLRLHKASSGESKGEDSTEGEKKPEDNTEKESTEQDEVVPVSKVTVTFDGRKGTIKEKSRTVLSGHRMGKLPAASRKGWTFAGWYTHKTKGKLVTEKTVIQKDITLYAHWIKGTIPKVTSVRVRPSAKTAVVSFKKAKADGYEIQYSLKKNLSKSTFVPVKKTSNKLKSLKAGRKYYVRVRAYKKDASGVKVYGKWSKKYVFRTKTR